MADLLKKWHRACRGGIWIEAKPCAVVSVAFRNEAGREAGDWVEVDADAGIVTVTKRHPATEE